MARVLIALSLLLLATPAAAQPAQIDNYDKIKTVAILTGFGDTLTVEGKESVFGRPSKEMDVSAWKIDAWVDNAVRHYLSKQFTIKDVPYDRKALNAVRNGHWDMTGGTLAVRAMLQALPHDGIDAFVVVRAAYSRAPINMTGLGLAVNEGSVNYEIDVWDAHTFEYLSRGHALLRMRKDDELGYPAFVAGGSLGAINDLTPTDKQLVRLHANFDTLLSVSLVETLRDLHLGTDLPEVGAREVVPVRADDVPVPDIKTIAVASAIGDEFQLYDGGGIFGGGVESFPIPDWNIDTEVEALVRDALDRRLKVKDVSIPREAVLQARLVDGVYAHRFKPNFAGLKPSSDVDAYLLVIKHPFPFFQPGMRQDGTGVGVVLRVADGRTTSIYAHYDIALVDARTLKLLSFAVVRAPPDYPSDDPWLNVDPSLWTDKPKNVTPEMANGLHQALSKFLADTIPETMLRAGLIGTRVRYVAEEIAAAAQPPDMAMPSGETEMVAMPAAPQ